MKERIKLSELRVGECGKVCCADIRGDMRRRLRDIGLIDGTKVECIGVSPCGDPKAYLIRGAVIALRSEDSGGIILQGGE